MRKRTLILSLAAAGLGLAVTGCWTPGQYEAKTELFNGKDLEGWKYVLADPNVRMDQVWSVQDGILTCQGEPVGFLFKDPEATDFRLIVEYRWAPDAKPGNSGIFSRIHGTLKPLPPAVEVQLKHGSAGDVLGLQGTEVAGGQERFFEVKKHALAGDIAGVKAASNNEKPAGEWNRVEILAQGPRYQVKMNGKVVNEVDGVEVVPGRIGLQSEGGVIQFRRVTLYRLF
ncbi:MAG TPA: DUF1080 domain-containing protein [Verrucomicrobiota bacterium]|nr:DUF1080 domain-containing protein [Verrucomicrobiota bacterium]HRT10409.1 DUF1080 domain-containing protein [Candidatus Paceibacterota bacterium]HRT57291.1 DUF1080 domain-containing protein [Candidatus Paceibacterota bacterium]